MSGQVYRNNTFIRLNIYVLSNFKMRTHTLAKKIVIFLSFGTCTFVHNAGQSLN